MNSELLINRIERICALLGEHMDIRNPREVLVSLTYNVYPYNEPFKGADFKLYLHDLGLRERMGSLVIVDLEEAHERVFGGENPWKHMRDIFGMGYAFHTYSPASLVLVVRRDRVYF